MKNIAFILICILFLLFLRYSKTVKDPEYLIFSGSYFSITDIEETNAAILIMDKDSIKYFKKLFYNNDLKKMCPCGYNYRIQFLNKRGTSIENVLYYPLNIYTNNDDKIKEEINTLSFRMHNFPTHYIYNIEIEGEPLSALKKMRVNGFLAFIMNDENNQSSTIQILYNDDFEC